MIKKLSKIGHFLESEKAQNCTKNPYLDIFILFRTYFDLEIFSFYY